MRRFIEILQEFQNSSRSLSLNYLRVKFSLTIRTLQRDIQRINSLLAEVSNCKIIKSKENLILIGDNIENTINILLRKFLASSNNSELKIYQFLLPFIWTNQPLTNSKLVNLTNGSLYSLKQEINLINSFFQYYQLDLNLKFRTKKGWELIGSEQDLRLLAINILVNLSDANTLIKSSNSSNVNYLDFNLFHLLDNLKQTLLESGIYQFYYHEILYFLVVMVRRIKMNRLLNNYHCHPFLSQLIDCEKTLKKHSDELVSLLQKNFALKLNHYERHYLKSLMFLHQKYFNNLLFSKFILKIESFIDKLIFKKYQLSLVVKNFKLTLKAFLLENCLKLLFNSYNSLNFNEFKKTLFSNDDSYFFGWEMLKIINFAFKQFNISINFNLFISNDWLINFDNLWNNQKNWIIPLYYQKDQNSYSQLNKIILFIRNNYPNIIVKSLNINNSVYKWNFLNKQDTIFLDDSPNSDFSHFNQILPVQYHYCKTNQQLQAKIDFAVETIMFKKLYASILVFDFFLKQKFYSLKTFLNVFQNSLVRKFKINDLDLDLKDAFVDERFFQANILVVHKLTPIQNINLPIILIYLKNPLFFHKRNPIHFIFILITNANNLYQYDWLISYLNLIKNSFNIEIRNVKNIYKIFNNSLSHGL